MLQNQPYDKFKPIYSGPYTVVDIDNPNIIIRNNKNVCQKVHKYRVRIYSID